MEGSGLMQGNNCDNGCCYVLHCCGAPIHARDCGGLRGTQTGLHAANGTLKYKYISVLPQVGSR